MVEDIRETKLEGASIEEIEAFIDFCSEWEEINENAGNWEF